MIFHFCRILSDNILCNGFKKSPSTFLSGCKRTFHLPSAVYERETKLMKKDKVSLESELIYRLGQPKLFVAFLGVTNASIVLLPIVGFFIYCERNGLINHTSQEIMNLTGTSLMYLSEKECYISVLVGVVFASLLNNYCSLFPVRIYSDLRSTKYTAVFMNSFFPWRTKNYEFINTKKGYRSTILDGKRAILCAECFRRPTDYIKLSGQYPIEEE